MKPPLLLKGRRRTHFILLVLNGLLQALAAVAFAWLAGRVFDKHLQVQATGLPVWVEPATGLLALALIIAMLRRRERIDAELLGQLYVRDLRKRLFARLLRSQFAKLVSQRRGLVLIRFVNDLNGIRQWVSLGLARLVVAAIVVTVAMVALWLVHPAYALVIGSSLGLMAAAMRWQGRRLRQAITEMRRRQGYLAANMTEKIGALATIQLFEQGVREQHRLARQNRRLINAGRDKAAAIGGLRAITEIGVGMAFSGSLIATLYLSSHGQVTPGAFVSVFSFIGFLAGPLRDTSRAHEYWLSRRVAMENLRKLSGRLQPLRHASDVPEKRVFEGAIQLKGLEIGRALCSIDACVKAGQRVALVGTNGAGKTTLLHLIARLREYERGEIQIDGVSIRDLPRAQLHELVAYVGHDAPLMRSSLLSNLLYGAHQPDRRWFDRVCRQCGIDSLADRLPKGMDTRIEEGGTNLSQGERSRVFLARALMCRPKILLLDEMDAHLDLQAAKAYRQVLADFPGTVLMATHRREAVRNADHLWHLHQGHLVAQGDPEKLLKNAGPTRHLFQAPKVTTPPERLAG